MWEASGVDSTNTSEKPCRVYRYPLVQIAAWQRLATEIKDGAPIPGTPYETVAPGEQLYAALFHGGPMDALQPEMERTITVQLQDTGHVSKKGEPITIDFPGTTYVYDSDSSQVTRWMTAPEPALRFIETP
ncbi:DUF4232 domain-containing protein [Streptomyces sp. NBC_01264]|uniref:DUF4232 domain-containing protein n=1 Tax=Streptomyces sp. NBC_01264 TaxID=2903804 RepID=UPI00225836C9|nr:DUF4232 domain-containing protein [Streptomyces sp. NBC_01264]MCX4775542.1 DUF4232 domain-containing protein [Streptomyces sp. NBC_01264]